MIYYIEIRQGTTDVRIVLLHLFTDKNNSYVKNVAQITRAFLFILSFLLHMYMFLDDCGYNIYKLKTLYVK